MGIPICTIPVLWRPGSTWVCEFLLWSWGLRCCCLGFIFTFATPTRACSRLLFPLGILLLLCHLAAFGIWAIAIGAFELAHPFGDAILRGRRAVARELLRRELGALVILLPPLIALVALSPPSLGGSGMRWSTLSMKSWEGFSAITFYANPGPELLLLALATAGFAASYFAGAIIVRRESVVMFICMTAVYLLLPRVGGGGGYVDYRMPWAAAFFLLSGVVPGRVVGRRTGCVIASFLGLLVVARIALITVQWQSWDPTIAGIVTALRTLPPGSRLLAVVGNPGSTSMARRPSLENMAAYAVAYRQAYWSGIFADISGQILSFRPPYRSGWRDPPAVVQGSVRAIDPDVPIPDRSAPRIHSSVAGARPPLHRRG